MDIELVVIFVLKTNTANPRKKQMREKTLYTNKVIDKKTLIAVMLEMGSHNIST